MAVLDEADRAVLREADAELHGIQEALEVAAEAGALDAEAFERLRDTAREVIARVNAQLPVHLDAEARDEIRRRLIDLLTLGVERDQLLDLADHALVELEAVRHVVRDLLDEQPPVAHRDEGATIRLLEEWLPTVPVAQLAELVGMSVRQLQRRRRDGGGVSSPRLQLVASLTAILRHAWTDRGVLAWFGRPRPELDDKAPIDVLDDPDREPDLMRLARTGRVQGAS